MRSRGQPFDRRGAIGTSVALALAFVAAADPLALLAWLALLAPAVGFALGRASISFWPFGPGLIGGWGAILTFVDIGAPRDLATPLWGLFAIAGFVGAGWALGAFRARRARDQRAATSLGTALGGGGILVLVLLAAAGASVQGGMARPEASIAREHPRLARALLELSPLTFVLECAGLDWTHAHADVYRSSGVEWFERHPFSGAMAGAVALVLGCGAAVLGAWRARAGPPDAAPGQPPG